jgi:hypothetical protein
MHNELDQRISLFESHWTYRFCCRSIPDLIRTKIGGAMIYLIRAVISDP